ncbi:unnamed protein product [Lathyrus sativus]|nr:unnamed protein product [Lathyrus sativus]CAK8082590.1 unnamed protein product [Lathyrus sativus]CAK8082594.1 unnamed protein product [Lathyrus sativus]CAK8082595.1 unnamed protein product [Lathyrus sativus]CAK8082597.1 unnamed protein product [Lathyrus sativus]
MGMISKAIIFSLSILMILPNTTYSKHQMPQKIIHSAKYVSEKFEIGPGEVVNKALYDIEFPKGHIGVKSFDVDLIDEQGNSIPLYETYFHHWFAVKYIITKEKKMPGDPNDQTGGPIYIRNDGTCNGGILPLQWGLGSESRGTVSNLPHPFAVELGNPANITEGWEERWLFSLMVIDTRGTKDRKSCSECRCDQFNLPKNFFNETRDIHNKPLSPEYKGGVFCCHNGFHCKLEEGFQAPVRKIALRYKITWVDWDQEQIPVRFYVLDSTDQVKTNGSKTIHDCLAEYTILKNNSSDSFHVQKASIPIEKGGYLVYGTAHMHTGVVNATLYGQDGRTLCTSIPRYGTGTKAGNEKGYVIEMSVCYPKEGSIKIKDGEIVTVESRYKNEYITGAMGHMYFYLADRLPHTS